MKYTTNKKFRLPEYTDVVDVEDFNENFRLIDKALTETETRTEALLTEYITDIDNLLGGGIEGAKLITFTIEGKEYQAEEGMTWAEWCDSEYNTAPMAYIQYDFVYYSKDGATAERIYGVDPTDFIIDGETYTLSNGAAN